jgi:1,2-diacylglycerol 3-alpha-glucosyltransferase
MRIAHFTNTYYPVISGVVRSVSAFRKALAELGHTVFVFAQDAPDYEDEEPFIFRYPALNLGLPGDFPATLPFSPFMDRLFPALKVEVIHSHHPFLLGQVAANKAEEMDLPLVFTFHTRYREYSHYLSLSQDFVDAFIQGAIDSWLCDYMQRCHHIVVPSESIREILSEEYGVESGITVVPTGIDPEPYQAADSQAVRRRHGWENETILVSVGRLALEKNWRTLLAAVRQVMATRASVRLVLIGDGPARRELEQYTRETGIANRVTFTGKLNFDQIPGYLKAADLFCFASTTETQGLVTMEAIAAGLPVVAVNASGTRDVVEHEREALLTENDSTALAQAIGRVLDDGELRERLHEGALEKARAFDINLEARKLVEVYETAQADHRAGRHVRTDAALAKRRRKIGS